MRVTSQRSDDFAPVFALLVSALAMACSPILQQLCDVGRLPDTFSSLVIFMEAVAAAIMAWAFLGERLSALQICGGVLILTGIYVARPRAQAVI